VVGDDKHPNEGRGGEGYGASAHGHFPTGSEAPSGRQIGVWWWYKQKEWAAQMCGIPNVERRVCAILGMGV